jgi:flavin reductase (DIM6/NTAB) family NADH-FMN oxidoreductase RutF
MDESPLPPTDVEAFKQAFRRHAAGVAAITSRKPDGTPVGFTATSLASLAASPPLVTFNMARVASAFPAITEGNTIVIHMLGPRSRRIAEIMAADNAMRFVGDHWRPGPLGLPVLDDVTAWMLARIVAVHLIADNAVVIARIEGGELGEPDDALVYHERTYMVPRAEA